MKFPLSGRVPGVLTAGVLGCVLLSASFAQPSASAPAGVASAGKVTLAQASESAWQRAVQAREADGQIFRAQAERLAASSLWAAPPALELSHRNDRWQTNQGRRESEIGLAWPLWLPGQRAARNAVVDAELDLGQAAVQAGRLHFAGLVREASWRLAAQNAEVGLADVQAGYLKGIAEDVDRRVKAGDLAHADALAARAELLSAIAAQSAARDRLRALQSEWAVLTGQQAIPDARETLTVTGPDLSSHPDVRLAELTVERARKRLDVVSVSRREPPELIFRLRQDVPGRAEPAQNSMGIGVRIPFGTDGRNQPLQAAAQSELDVAQTSAQRLRDRLSAEAAVAYAAVVSTQEQLDAERTRAGLLRERALLIDRSFKAGETPLPELLRSLNAASQADAALVRQQNAAGLARARLQQTLGIIP
ncbi:TolC family protein [Polaromonas sp.]|uniref:TolC family protein n=1 Tax=Polaromonas sp. TaxID=1869339 RepID=UPI0037532455